MGRVVLVVARFAEDLGWLGGWAGEVVVVQKGRDLPNVGREASSWLWWMSTARIDPDATYAFLQGDPFPHGFEWSQLREVDGFGPLGAHVLTCDHDGLPHHGGLDLAVRARAWLGAELPPEVTFHAGAQFLAPGRLLLTRTPGWYAALRDRVERADQGPWAMERLWRYAWAGIPGGRELGGAPGHRAGDPAPRPAPPLPPRSTPVRDLLGQHGVYDGFADEGPPDLSGWCPDALPRIVAGLMGDAPPASVVVEVGSWKGRSAVAIAAGVSSAGRWAEIVCVDTWLGSPEFWGPGAHSNHDLRRERGFPRVYETFLRNVAASGLAGQVTPFPISSVQGAAVLRRLRICPWLVYVDAAHEADAVEADCDAWWPVVSPGGAMLGDDWGPHWPGVEAGVTAWARRLGVEVEVDGVVWIARKRN